MSAFPTPRGLTSFSRFRYGVCYTPLIGAALPFTISRFRSSSTYDAYLQTTNSGYHSSAAAPAVAPGTGSVGYRKI